MVSTVSIVIAIVSTITRAVVMETVIFSLVSTTVTMVTQCDAFPVIVMSLSCR